MDDSFFGFDTNLPVSSDPGIAPGELGKAGPPGERPMNDAHFNFSLGKGIEGGIEGHRGQ